ncbi:MAG: oligosaccharide flippase family protein [Gammaproteobacteria bacterium]|nr:oligosaccharide flippase family protein [Pseudomonadales bacterium]
MGIGDIQNDLFGMPGSVARSQFILVSANLLKLMLSLIATVFLGRVLSPADFGFFSLITGLLAFCYTISDLGSNDIVTREISANQDLEKPLLESLMLLRVAIACVLALIWFYIASVQVSTGQRIVFICLAISMYAIVSNALVPAFTIRQSQLTPAIALLVPQATFLILTVILYYWNFPPTGYSLLVIAREFTAMTALYFLSKNLLGFAPRPNLSNNQLPRLAPGLLTIGASTVFFGALFQIGFLYVWLKLDAEQLGPYGAALRLFLPLISLPYLLAAPLLPQLTRDAITNLPGFKARTSSLIPFLIGISAIVSTTGLLYSESILAVLYGEKYITEPLSAVSTMGWFSAAYGLLLILPFLVATFIALGQEKKLLLLSVSACVVDVITCAIFIPTLGISAAAMALTSALFILLISGFSILFLSIGLRVSTFSITLALVPAAAIYLTEPWLTPESSIPALTFGLIVAVLAVSALWRIPSISGGWRELRGKNAN